MKRLWLLAVPVVLVAGLVALPSSADTGDGRQDKHLATTLDGYQEVPAVSTVAGGSFSARIANDAQSIDWTLTYDSLEGQATQAHIHVGQAGVNGGVSVFLCSNLGNGPAGTPACAPTGDTLSGTLTAASVVGPAAQGVA